MKILVLSDIHDHILNLQKVIKIGKEIKVNSVIFCGDMCAPFTSQILGSINVSIYACFGNVDGDQVSMLELGGKNFNWIALRKEFGEIRLDKRKIAFCHYPKLAELLAKTNDFDAVFYGHTHLAKSLNLGKTLLANPGAVCGIQNGKPGTASFGIYETEKNSLDIVEIK